MGSIKFTGILSGDHESFCFAVSKENFTRITGREPEDFDKDRFYKGKYAIYPSDILGRDGCDQGDAIIVSMEWVKV